jgi:hypothetical protein
MKYPACPGSAPGPFWVEEGCCAFCEAPLVEAPELMEFDERPHCRFRRQPQTEEELEHAIRAVQVCCTGAVRYGGDDKEILDRIHWARSCDQLPPRGD